MKTKKGKAGKTALIFIASILVIVGWIFFIIWGPAYASRQKQATGAAGGEKLAEQSKDGELFGKEDEEK
jgi:hypothetical protein